MIYRVFGFPSFGLFTIWELGSLSFLNVLCVSQWDLSVFFSTVRFLNPKQNGVLW